MAPVVVAGKFLIRVQCWRNNKFPGRNAVVAHVVWRRASRNVAASTAVGPGIKLSLRRARRGKECCLDQRLILDRAPS
jgi:hypothetical protein